MNPVINLHHFKNEEEIEKQYGLNWTYCGRAGSWRCAHAETGAEVSVPLKGSPLANPFKITSANDRERAIAQYRTWLWQAITQRHVAVIRALKAIDADTALACWCAPKHCHCHVIAKAAAWLRTQGEPKAESGAQGEKPPRRALRPKPPLPIKAQPTEYCGITVHHCPTHPSERLHLYNLPRRGLVHAHKLPAGTWCATVPPPEAHAAPTPADDAPAETLCYA